MLISRCAWHPLYVGEPLELGRADDGLPEIDHTDGICPPCHERLMTEFRREVAAERAVRRRDAGDAP